MHISYIRFEREEKNNQYSYIHVVRCIIKQTTIQRANPKASLHHPNFQEHRTYFLWPRYANEVLAATAKVRAYLFKKLSIRQLKMRHLAGCTHHACMGSTTDAPS